MPAYFGAARTQVFQCSSITAPDSYERRFIDKGGVKLYLELTLGYEPEQEVWEQWQEYRAEDAEFYDDLKSGISRLLK